MKFNQLALQSKLGRRRVGRGISAGQGKTAGRGTKGQRSRTGFKRRSSFEGGQTPLAQRIPKKRGFKSIRIPAQIVYTDTLNDFPGKVVNNQTLAEASYIADPFHTTKIILRGELNKALTVNVERASQSAIAAITAAGGKYEATQTPRKSSAKPSKKPASKEEASDK